MTTQLRLKYIFRFFRNNMRSFCNLLPLAAAAAFTMLGVVTNARANVINIAVQNGSFETLGTPNTSGQLYAPGATNNQNTQTVTGWTSSPYSTGPTSTVPGYNFVMSSDATANASGAYGPSYGSQYGDLYLWSQNPDDTSNGIGTSPAGGNFLAMDGAFESSAISQVISGLTIGMDTKVYFYYAGAQQYTFTGPTTEAFQVSLTDNTGATPSTQSVTTAYLDDSSHGFTGWHYTEVDFVPTATTETLSFLAKGTPDGLPPFSLLDGVSIVQVTPEPSTLALLGTGVLAVGGLLRRRRMLNQRR